MTGPEHFREAEMHLKWSTEVLGDEDIAEPAGWHQRQAQVHATLALAAATALGRWTESGMPQPDRMDWWRVASGDPAERQRTKEAKAAEAADLRASDADGAAA